MLKLGVMTKVFPRPTIEAVAEAVQAAGLTAVQLNLESAGMEALPPALDAGACRRIRGAFAERGIVISAVSGTFNAIDPDRTRREQCIQRLGVLAARCAALGTAVITLCTGTRDANSMWRAHPENGTPAAWQEMVVTMRALVRHAEAYGVTLAFEPEVVNVVDTAEKAARLIAEVGSERVRVVMDPANYFHPSMLDRMAEVLEDAFTHVGRFIALAHAKDVRAPDPGGDECIRPAAGKGMLDYHLYLRLLRDSGYDGGLIMHSLDEADVSTSTAFVARYLAGEI